MAFRTQDRSCKELSNADEYSPSTAVSMFNRIFYKIIPGYSIIARSLTNLLKTEVKFKFESLENSAYNQLKSMLVNKPVLKLYKVGAEIELRTDASSHGYGAILLQRCNNDNAMHPVYYASDKTTPDGKAIHKLRAGSSCYS